MNPRILALAVVALLVGGLGRAQAAVICGFDDFASGQNGYHIAGNLTVENTSGMFDISKPNSEISSWWFSVYNSSNQQVATGSSTDAGASLVLTGNVIGSSTNVSMYYLGISQTSSTMKFKDPVTAATYFVLTGQEFPNPPYGQTNSTSMSVGGTNLWVNIVELPDAPPLIASK